MKELFPEPRPRRANGQFATKEMAFADKQRKENITLRAKAEMYERMYLSLAKENKQLKETINQIKTIIR